MTTKLNVNHEMKKFEKTIQSMSRKFMRKYNSKSVDGQSIYLFGYTVEDIQQELRVKLWKVVTEINNGVVLGDFDSQKYEYYILAALNYRILGLIKELNIQKRGFNELHDYSSIAVSGMFDEQE